MCVDTGACAAGAVVGQCPAPPTLGSTQVITAAPGAETVPVPGSQQADGVNGSTGADASVIAVVVALLLYAVAAVVCIVQRRRKNARALNAPRPVSTRATMESDGGATQLRYYGEAPGPEARRSRMHSRSASRTHLRHHNAGPATYGPGPGAQGASWASGGYGASDDGRYHRVADNEYAPVSAPQATYRDLDLDTSYQSLSMKQQSYDSRSVKPQSYESLSMKQPSGADQYHAPRTEVIPPSSSSHYCGAPKKVPAASGQPHYATTGTGRPGASGASHYVAQHPGPARGGATMSAYASTSSSTYSGTALQSLPTRNVQSETYNIMYAPVS